MSDEQIHTAPTLFLLMAQYNGPATLPGLLIGGGVEYAFSPNWTGKVEYNSIFVRDNVNFTVCGPGACAVTSTQSAAKQTVKVGINYMFH